MSPKSRIDPRLLGIGLLTGAVVGVWAGRRAQEWTAGQPSGEGMIDWERARSVAIAMNRDAALTIGERTRLDREYYDLVQQTIPLVSAHSGVLLPRPLDEIYAFDRVDWINANIVAFQHMFEPIERMDIFGNPNAPRAANVLWSGLNRTVVSAELGFLLGYLARRVLGQYDLALLGREPIETSGKLYFVQPNIRNTERTLGIPSGQFRLWLALHETTHAFEFEAYPWVREHMNTMIQEYFTFLTEDIEYLKRGLSGLKAFWERARNNVGSDSAGWIELVMSPEQRRLFGRMQATMAVVEGYSNYIMNAVGRDLMPDYTQIAQRFEQRQKQKSQ
ncbi:MAG: zinc-dependent metalloprotease, partial [Thermomicrobiales bacterium]